MRDNLSDHQRKRREMLKHQLMLAIPVMSEAETLSKRCDLDICFVYASEKEMSDYIASYSRDVEDLRATVVNNFQEVYRTVVFAGREYYDFLFEACENEGLFNASATSRKKHVEAGMPISKNWIQRRFKVFDKRAKAHVAQLADDNLKIQEIAKIQDSLGEALERLLEALTEMYDRLVAHIKVMRDKDRLKWSKIGVFVGGGGSVAKLFVGGG